MGVLGGIVYFLLALGILVTIHELGHFLMARACKVKVLRFSLGFGPVILQKTGKDGCEYAISAIPLGGYVKMEGENSPQEDTTELAPDSFKAKSVWQRALIIFAGPFFNIALAVILFTVVNLSGIQERLPVVGDVVPHSLASESGFAVYDKIDSIKDKKVDNWSDFVFALIENLGTEHVTVSVSGDLGRGAIRTLNLNLKDINLERNESPLEKIGLKICYGNITTVLDAVMENSPAYAAGLRVNDEIISINDLKVNSWYRLQDEILNSHFKELNLVVKRDGKLYSTKVKPEPRYDKEKKIDRPFLGIGAKVIPLEGLTSLHKYTLTEGFIKACKDAAMMSKLVVVSAYKLLNGTISADNISGPIAIAKGAQESAQFGFVMFLSFLAAISVNLGILNLIPIPVLDGGQLVFLAYEAVMGKEPSAGVQRMLTAIGAGLLLTLTIFAIFNDIKGL